LNIVENVIYYELVHYIDKRLIMC